MNRIKYRYLLYFVPALLLASMAFISPQNDLPKRLASYLNTFRSQYAPEKVYVQTDKPYYAPGQAIWLKGYVVDAATLRPSAKSSVLYVDLLDADNKPVHRLTLKAANGKAIGDMILPDSLPEGTYRLSAYTQWMRNFGESSFFNKPVNVFGPGKNSTKQAAAAVSQDIDFQLFPEGGDMVQGLLSRVAFKATGPGGNGVTVSGSVLDDQGREILDFRDTHLGMGAFELQPQEGRAYVARIKTKNGKTLEYALPAAKAKGYVLRIDEAADEKSFHVMVSGNVNNQEPLVLTGISQDALQYSQTITLQPGQAYRQEILTSQFPTGITRFNLARTNGEPLAERLVFVNHHDNLDVTLTANKATFEGREQVTLQLQAKGKDGKPVATDFSLAVTDTELVKQNENGPGIKSYLLLTSDLRGRVEQPGYYFESSNPQRKEALQYLLMTQGWRRFSWEEAVTGTFPALQYPSEHDLTISGQLLTDKGKPVADGEALLYLQGQHQAFITTKTNREGAFAFRGFDFTGDVNMVVQGTDARGRRKHLQVVIDENDFIPQAPATFAPQADGLLAAIKQKYVEANNQQIASVTDINQTYTLKGILLPEIDIQGEEDVYVPFKLHQKADVVLIGKELPVAPSGNILESLQGRVAGLQVFRSGPNQFRASIRGQQAPPLYLIDGIPVSEASLTSLSQFDISRIEVLKSSASAGIYGGRASGGVIAFFTNRGGGEEVEVEPGTYIIVHQAKGYSKVREFYSPRYDEQNSASDAPDLRTTLYWTPSVRTDANGKATVTFYTADRNTTYRVIAEGISDEGKPGRGTLTFDVDSKKLNR
ncbi:TonB-dependent receptor plug domain-containing protein [Pontibacter silvestris]|uniref:TonB-dependent receptor plug domain-containing protein n=1 Tax=Pontibacter silvestris TaxID=2305183 RepID=A0ABW4WRQ1_9BACT|nr:TonB-dependent receptor plug domain-containing protein [Pontibacter silvestris]MCC9138140.1 TonB-dependent receptor plug domain-containing protein [Pontibacter silvestris]